MPHKTSGILLSSHTLVESSHDNLLHIVKFGTNESVGTTFAHIWPLGGIYNWPSVATTVRVASGGSSNDAALGSGARTIVVDGLDENFDIATEEITLAGSSASVSTTTTFIRVHRAFVTEVGSYGGVNAGEAME